MTVSWNPRILAVDSFLSEHELSTLMAYLTALPATAWGHTSLIGKNGLSVPGHTITSLIHPLPDPVQRLDVDLTALRARIANLTLLPVENIETLYALKYEPGQFFQEAHSYFLRVRSVTRMHHACVMRYFMLL